MGKQTEKKNVLLGVCGGISSYKSCRIASLLVENGYALRVIMTKAATRFVAPLVFETLAGFPVAVEMFDGGAPRRVQHVSLAQWADLCVIAPLSANTLSKIACGICDNLLTTTIAALGEIKVLCAPAMNENMWLNPFIQDNVGKMRQTKKYLFIPTGKGRLACGDYGEGRMAEPEVIFRRITEVSE